MNLAAIFENKVLIPALTAWMLAQIIKLPLEYVRTRRWNWNIVMSVGGMPSSHSALVVGATWSIGLHEGFDSALFAMAIALSMVVLYDATGIRRQAGKHAQIINVIIDELAAGHPLKEEQLREVLGHTPLQVFAGTVQGIVIAQLFWMLWH
jgi:acid phosphatase family membrane protein YuiD